MLQRDGHRCVRCGSQAEQLVAAHWPVALRDFAAEDPAAYSPASGVTLCLDCHRDTDPWAR